jgi:DNA polymerase III alpha subunit
MTVQPFYEIGLRSNFSFLDGASHAEELVERALLLGLSGLGLADRNTVAGVVRLHASAKLNGLEFRPGARLIFDDDTPELLAYPMNRKGWGNLCRMLSQGNLRSKKGVCTLWQADLLEWSGDLLFVAMPPSLPETADVQTFETRLAPIRVQLEGCLYLALTPRYDGFDRRPSPNSAGSPTVSACR